MSVCILPEGSMRILLFYVALLWLKSGLKSGYSTTDRVRDAFDSFFSFIFSTCYRGAADRNQCAPYLVSSLQMAGFAIMRSGETLPEGTATMSDSASIFRLTTSRNKPPGTTTTGGACL